MSDNKIFLHLEDEIERMEWIPSAMRTYCKNRLDFEVSSLERGVENGSYSFRSYAFDLRKSSGNLVQREINIKYIYFLECSDLIGYLNESPLHLINDMVFILDLMNEKGEITQTETALNYICSKNADKRKVFIFTGYAPLAHAAFNGCIIEENILPKPKSPREIVPIFLSSASIIMRGDISDE